ncbi:MAG: Rid family hydrolase [Pseudomonadota bacterium]
MLRHGIAVLAVLMFCSGCATAVKPPAGVVVPDGMETTYREFQYAPAVRAGSMLYLSGVVARIADGETSMVPAIERAFDEIETILSHAGATWSDVVDVTSYMTDLDAQIGPLWQVKGQRVTEPYPAWTAIGVERLYGGDAAIIEIKVTAYLHD